MTADVTKAQQQLARITPYEFLLLSVQLGLVLTIAVLYRIELDRGFGALAVIIFGGFLVHAWLPLTYRLSFFILLTLTAIGYLLRWDAIALVATGGVLIAVCHLKIAWSVRVALVAIIAAGLAAIQLGAVENPTAETVIPILGAMFMFRIILYLYDLKEDSTPASPVQRIAYFFLLPNVCFPLFPVVDYKTFIRTYYDAPAADVYRKGLLWMYRGVAHLLLYRLVYYLLPRADSDLTGVFGVYVFMAMTYGLYLRVSGLFHLIVGSLCLFGFNLPRTNNNYFAATSFTDLWRRINIYWKDFMMTAVFYPVFMAVRRWSMTRRLVLGTAAVFVVTWFLHSYQWFWLQGVFPLTGIDVAFWGFLGVALAINSVLEAKRGRQRADTEWSWSSALRRALQALGVFSVMATLWTLWYSESFADWGYRLQRIGESRPQDWMYLVVLIVGVVAAGTVAQWLQQKEALWGRMGPILTRRASDLAPVGAVVLLAIWTPIGPNEAQGSFERVISRLQSTEPNRIDRERQERGYYEVLSRSTNLEAAGNPIEAEAALNSLGAKRETSDLRGSILVPGARVEWRGSNFSVNRWGMRDREYQQAKPARTHRMALLGASYEMGSGVSDHETFENRTEEHLNRELAGGGYQTYEILNFGVGGYSSVQMLYLAEHELPAFQPDVVLFVVHPGEKRRIIERLHLVLERGATLGAEYDPIAAILRTANAGTELPRTEFVRRVDPHGKRLLEWTFRRMTAVVRTYGAIPVFVFLPLTDSDFPKRELEEMTDVVTESGGMFIVLEDPYGDNAIENIRVAEWDNHPNALGHSLIADRLYSALLDRGAALGIVARDGQRSPQDQ